MREADINRKSLLRSIADLFQKMLPVNTPARIPKSEVSDFSGRTSKPATPSLQAFDTQGPSTSREIIYQTPDPSPAAKDSEEPGGNVEDNYLETDAQDFGNRHFGKIARTYVTSYLYNRAFLDTDFGIPKDADGQFRIGKSSIEIEENSDVFVEGNTYSGRPGLFELLTRQKVNKSLITTKDLKNYRCIL